MTDTRIPKIIHFCWFGKKPLPTLAEKCIASWEKYLPDYEIKRWDETNFDVNITPYTSQAYSAGKYAFVSDYARFWILYNYGGIYFDTDVEIIKPIYDIIENGPFMGCENMSIPDNNASSIGVAPGLGIAAYPRHSFYKKILSFYEKLEFLDCDGASNLKTIVEYTSELLCQSGLKNTHNIQTIEGINIYPKEYFCPLSPTLVLDLTENSRTIHHYSASWESKMVKFRKKIKRTIGYKTVTLIQPTISYLRKFLRK